MSRNAHISSEGGDFSLTRNVPERTGGSEQPTAEGEELAALKDRLLRALADHENVRQQARRDRNQAVRYAVADFAADLLATADNLEHAIASVPQEARADRAIADLIAGIEATRGALLDAFARHGLERFEPIDQPFDPNHHEASFEVIDDLHPPGSIVSIIRPGYRLHDRLLRPALVGVSKARAAAEDRSDILGERR